MSPKPESKAVASRRANLGDSDHNARAAADLFAKAIDHLIALSAAGVSGGGPRLFFPNGIELIRITFKVGSEVDVSFVIAGEKAPKEATYKEPLPNAADLG